MEKVYQDVDGGLYMKPPLRKHYCYTESCFDARRAFITSYFKTCSESREYVELQFLCQSRNTKWFGMEESLQVAYFQWPHYGQG